MLYFVNQKNMSSRLLAIVWGGVLFLFSVMTQAQQGSAKEKTTLDWMLDVDLGYQQQTIQKSTAELTSITFSPSVIWGNWDLSLTVPWYETQGEFYINGIRSRLAARCERITNLAPALQKLLVGRGLLTQKQIQTCDLALGLLTQLNAKQNGIGDVTGFAHYNFPLGADTGWGASLGVGYKSNTGDSDTGLGSGTQDGLFELGVFFAHEQFSLSLNAGYDFVSGDAAIADVYQTKNFAYTSINLSKDFTDWFRLGVNFSGQQAYIVHGGDTKIFTEYIDLTPFEKLSIHVFVSQYSGDDLLPDKEVGANLTYSF